MLAIVRTFAEEVRNAYRAGDVAQPEDQLKRPVANLIEHIGRHFGHAVRANTEVRAYDVQGRPDLGVWVDDLLCGHIELKAPEVSVNPRHFRDHNRKQWEKFKSLPNLIYTNGNEWRLFRGGEQVGVHFRFTGDLTVAGGDAVTEHEALALEHMLRDFVTWNPQVPASPRELAAFIAPICRLIRGEAEAALQDPESALSLLANEWRGYLFPDADDKRFADAYAQTLTYALLLASLSVEGEFDPRHAADVLRPGHNLLARVLEIFTDPETRRDIKLGADLLERVVRAMPAERLRRGNPRLWLYFYEDFLAAYDPKLRKDYGVYYTPAEVVQCQVRLISRLLENNFGKRHGFADDDVVFLDPAAGTGTYPISAIQYALERVEQREGPGAVPARAAQLARNMHAFEVLVGPYAVAHLRLTQALAARGGPEVVPPEGVHVYLHDTLESPFIEPPGQPDLLHRPLVEENRKARRVKAETRVLVCLGNPPYDRQVIDPGEQGVQRKGGWVRRPDDRNERPIIQDFLDPAREAGAGIHLKNLYNDYVYFWRWALWKVPENNPDGGIVSFITASSYLRGPGFVGMRRLMRELFHEVWIIDLEGDNLGARKTENVFQIQTPVAIAIGVTRGRPDRDTPATVRYTRITGSRADKLAALDRVEDFADLEWQTCFEGWDRPFLPESEGAFFDWPALTDLFPWQHSGVQFKRTWPIAPTEEVLQWRWRELLRADRDKRAELFRETRDRKVERAYRSWATGERLSTLATLPSDATPPLIQRYAYRSFDRQYALADPRLADFPKPVLWRAHGPRQLYLTSLLTEVLGEGPAAVATALVPDLHHFRGSFGGKHVIPFYRDAEATQANVTPGVLEHVSDVLGRAVTAEDLFAYAYAVLANPAYVLRFSEELTIPGPRLPITRDPALFAEAVAAGRRLIWLHSFGERMVPEGARPGDVPQGHARCQRPIPVTEAGYPEDYEYDAATGELRVGAGLFAPVAREVFEFSVSGLPVVKSWLDYRMRDGAGRRSSSLDSIRPRVWTAAMTEELLALLWVLEATVAMYPALSNLLDRILRSDLVPAAEFPQPSREDRQPPEPDVQEDQLNLV